MPYNGSGKYSAPTNSFAQAVGNTSILSADWNSTRADLETALSTCITKDGQTTITANLPMGTYRHTGVGNASALTDYASSGQVVKNLLKHATLTSSGTDTYTANLAISPASYSAGQIYSFIPDVDNTGACSINFNSIGAVSIKMPDGSDPDNGVLKSGYPIAIQYDGTNFILVSAPNNYLKTTSNDTTAGDITINKNSPSFKLEGDGVSGNNNLWFSDAGTNKAVAYWERASDYLFLQKYSASGGVITRIGLSAAGTISVLGVFESDLTINKASPAFTLQCTDEATENTVLRFRDENSILRGAVYRPAGTDSLRLDARDATGTTQCTLILNEAGNITYSGTLDLTKDAWKIGATTVTTTAAELNVLDSPTLVITSATTTSLAANDLTYINFSSIFDRNTEHSGGAFSPATTGYYQVDLSLYIIPASASSGDYVEVHIYDDGFASIYKEVYPVIGTTPTTLKINTKISLSSTGSYYIACVVYSSVSMTVSTGSTLSRLTISRLP